MALLKNISIKNQKGQILVESVLLMVFAMGVLTIATSTMKKNKVVQNLVQKPWAIVAGMVETGNWTPIGSARPLHPNRLTDMLSKKCGDSGGC